MNNIKKNIRRIIILFLILGLIYCGNDFYKEKSIRLVEKNSLNEINTNITNQIYKRDKENIFLNDNIIKNSFNNKKIEISNNTIQEEFFGYKIDGILEIPKINLNTYIFDEYSEDRMNISPTKLWGPEMNKFGNYSIIGHNYKKENMFNNLIELKIGDKFYLTDRNNRKLEYTIYDIYKVKENNIEPIKQGLKENIEVTLITCVNYTNNRLIVKARSEM